MGNLQARVLEKVAMPFLGVLVFRNYNLNCTLIPVYYYAHSSNLKYEVQKGSVTRPRSH